MNNLRGKAALLLLCLFGGCVSMRQYKRDTVQINQNTKAQEALDNEVIKALKTCETIFLTLNNQVTELKNRIADLETAAAKKTKGAQHEKLK